MAQDPDRGSDDDDGPPDDRPMSLFDHLEELRRRLFRAIVWLAVGTAIAYFFSNELLAIIARPLKLALEEGGVVRGEIVATEVGTKFFTALKASLVFGVFLSGPFVLREVWQFVAPGLYPKERRWIVLYAPFSYVLFATGALFFYFLVQPVMLEFFLEFGRENPDKIWGDDLPVREMIDIGRWFTLWTGMLLIMGIIFQLPLLMLAAAATGVVDAGTFASYRRHFIVGAVIAAAFLTPTGDAVTLSLTMVPIVALYEIGIVLCRLIRRRRQEDAR